MSKLAHSDQDTMDELDLERAIRDGNEDWIIDRFLAVHINGAALKLIAAMKGKRGTKLSYPEVRAIARVLINAEPGGSAHQGGA